MIIWKFKGSFSLSPHFLKIRVRKGECVSIVLIARNSVRTIMLSFVSELKRSSFVLIPVIRKIKVDKIKICLMSKWVIYGRERAFAMPHKIITTKTENDIIFSSITLS